jgi:hypothetical protein
MALGVVEFEARARTWTGGEVILTVQALREIDQLGGQGGGGVVVEFAGTDPGVLSGVVRNTPQVAARWMGSGVRQGRLTFTARTETGLQGGVLPLRFVLSLP